MGAFDFADDGAALFDHLQGASLNNPAWHPGISTAFGGGNALSVMVWTARFPSGLELELERAGAGRWAWGRGEARLVLPRWFWTMTNASGSPVGSSGSVQGVATAQRAQLCVSLHEEAAQEGAFFGPSSRKRHFMNRTPDAIAKAQAFAIVTGHASVMTP